jgi:hypothetical protein
MRRKLYKVFKSAAAVRSVFNEKTAFYAFPRVFYFTLNDCHKNEKGFKKRGSDFQLF